VNIVISSYEIEVEVEELRSLLRGKPVTTRDGNTVATMTCPELRPHSPDEDPFSISDSETSRETIRLPEGATVTMGDLEQTLLVLGALENQLAIYNVALEEEWEVLRQTRRIVEVFGPDIVEDSDEDSEDGGENSGDGGSGPNSDESSSPQGDESDDSPTDGDNSNTNEAESEGDETGAAADEEEEDDDV